MGRSWRIFSDWEKGRFYGFCLKILVNTECVRVSLGIQSLLRGLPPTSQCTILKFNHRLSHTNLAVVMTVNLLIRTNTCVGFPLAISRSHSISETNSPSLVAESSFTQEMIYCGKFSRNPVSSQSTGLNKCHFLNEVVKRLVKRTGTGWLFHWAQWQTWISPFLL